MLFSQCRSDLILFFSTDDAIGSFLPLLAVFWHFPALFAAYFLQNPLLREISTHNA
jgi:hypothetical protein